MEVAMMLPQTQHWLATTDSIIKIIGTSASSQQPLINIIWKEGSRPDDWSQPHLISDHISSDNSIAWAPQDLDFIPAVCSSNGNISVQTAPFNDDWDIARIDQAYPISVTSFPR